MNTYKVIVSQVVWYEAFVEADSEEEAAEFVVEDEEVIEWRECAISDLEIDQIDEVSHD